MATTEAPTRARLLTIGAVCRRLKSDPATQGTHVVILTARGQEEDERRAMEMGADEFMTKPFSPRKLRARILQLLGDPGRE